MAGEQSEIPYQEIQIKVPYGHVAAKAYNDPSGKHVLCLHGVSQNAASFDGLAPLLPKIWYIVAVDIATCPGRSSFMPLGTLLDYIHVALYIRCVMDGLKWDRMSVIAHSGGTMITVALASMYPDMVTSAVFIDLYKNYKLYDPINKSSWGKYLANAIKDQVHLEIQGKAQQQVTMLSTDAVDFFSRAYSEVLPKKQAEWLAERYVKENDDGSLCYNIERRESKSLFSFLQNDSVWHSMIESLSWHLMIIKYKNGVDVTPEEKEERLAQLKRVCKSLEYIEFPGTHCEHLKQPDVIAPHITDFMNKHHM